MSKDERRRILSEIQILLEDDVEKFDSLAV
jgi:hypothetical protein